jgi:glycosyltransferase involved in cell wall biosynthesis
VSNDGGPFHGSSRLGRVRPQQLTLVMPVFNERATLRPAVERLLKTQLALPVELVVVDDGSEDGSLDTVTDLAGDRVRLIRRARNGGKGAAIRTGIEAARGDLLGILDADLEYDPLDYSRLLRPILDEEAEVVYGTRAFGAHTAFSFWYVIGNKLVNLWASFLYNSWLSDVYTCFKLAPTSLWRSLDLQASGFGIEAEATAKFLAQRHQIYEVPISYRARGRVEGKKIRAADGLKALWILLRLRARGS